MDIEVTLSQLADEHLVTMRKAPWSAFAEAIHKRSPGMAGETFGCEVGGLYFDVGDSACWVNTVDGDILLTAHATTCRSPDQKWRVERTAVIKRP